MHVGRYEDPVALFWQQEEELRTKEDAEVMLALTALISCGVLE